MMYGNKELIEALHKQKDELLKENDDNLTEFEDKLRSRFNRSLEMTEDLDIWKRDVNLILRLYINNNKQIKPAFQLFNSEDDKKLKNTGQEFKEKLVNVMDYTQRCMEQYLANYRVEPIISANSKAFHIYNPKLDLESMLFNVEVAQAEPIQATPNKPLRNQPSSNELILNCNDLSPNDPLSRNSITKNTEFTPIRKDDNLLTEISIADIPDLDQSKPPRELPPAKAFNFNPSTTTQNFLSKDRSFTKTDDNGIVSYTVSQKNQTTFKRQYSPNLIKEVQNSPKDKKRASINNVADAGLGYRSDSKKNLFLNEYKTHNPKGKTEKSFTNIGDNTSILNKLEPSKGTTLKQLMSGRHSEILTDLKKNALSSLDLSFAGELIRP